MKIAYLCEKFDPSLGGAERYAWDFTSALASAGHEVSVFAAVCGPEAPKGVTVRPVRGSDFGADVERELAEEEFDVVHGTGWTWGADVFQPHGGVHLANREARRACRLCDAINPKQRRFRRIERRQYVERPPALFVALSEMVKRDMQRFYSVADEKIRVVYNGVDVERFHPRNREAFRADVRKRLGIGEDELVFLIVAHNFQLKGVGELSACVLAEGFPACRVVVVGKGKAVCRSESGRLVLAGAVEDAAPYYAAADAYVHPTHYDPCSLTVLEALASGLPVVTTTMNGAGELMTDGREGFIIPPRDPEALNSALWAMLEPARRAEMGLTARALAEEHTIGDNVREMLAVYEETIRLKGRS